MQRNELINRVIIVMGRSLLQYSTQVWPWTPGNSHLREPLDELIAAQGGRIERLCEVLSDRGWPIDFGAFPDFTDLHFLALDYLWPYIVENQRAVDREIQIVLTRCIDDPQASDVLSEVLAEERAALLKLETQPLVRPALADV